MYFVFLVYKYILAGLVMCIVHQYCRTYHHIELLMSHVSELVRHTTSKRSQYFACLRFFRMTFLLMFRSYILHRSDHRIAHCLS